jgi:hypothetical protein
MEDAGFLFMILALITYKKACIGAGEKRLCHYEWHY